MSSRVLKFRQYGGKVLRQVTYNLPEKMPGPYELQTAHDGLKESDADYATVHEIGHDECLHIYYREP